MNEAGGNSIPEYSYRDSGGNLSRALWFGGDKVNYAEDLW
jgi:hypothetical protein